MPIYPDMMNLIAPLLLRYNMWLLQRKTQVHYRLMWILYWSNWSNCFWWQSKMALSTVVFRASKQFGGRWNVIRVIKWRGPLEIVGHFRTHYNDVIRGAMASQITSLTVVYSIFYSGADQRKHQSSASVRLQNLPWYKTGLVSRQV